MASSSTAAVAAFIEGAPPGELSDVVKDIRSLTASEPQLLTSAPVVQAFKKYNEEQFTVVKLPTSSQNALITPYNFLEDGRYFDVSSGKAFRYEHTTQRVSNVESYASETQHTDFISTLQKSLNAYASEHYPPGSYTTGVFPTKNDSELTLVIVGNKYSPGNFWNGRWRSLYTLSPTSPPTSITGTLHISVHYYEDGNVRLSTTYNLPSTSLPTTSTTITTTSSIIKQIATFETDYQTQINKGFRVLGDEVFKKLRRQLPVTRQKVEWEKVGGYRLGQEVGGGAAAGR